MAIAIIGPKFYGFDPDTGKPLAGGKVYFYQAGTNIPLDTYTDETGETANPNPVILNAAGYAGIYLNGVYKIVLTDANDVQIYSVDNVNSALQTASEWVKDQPISYGGIQAFTVPGNQIDVFESGRALRVENQSGEFHYGFVANSIYQNNETIVEVEFPGDYTLQPTDSSAAVGLLTKDSFGGFSAKDASDFGGLRNELSQDSGAMLIGTGAGVNLQEFLDQLGYTPDLIDEHNDDPEAHAALTAFITQQVDLANTAAEAAIAAGHIYETLEIGLQNTEQGDFFIVPVADENVFYTLYKNTSVSGGTPRTAQFEPSPGSPAVALKSFAADAYDDKYTANYSISVPQVPNAAAPTVVMVYFQGRRSGATWSSITSKSYVVKQGESIDSYPNQAMTGEYIDAGENCEFRLLVETSSLNGATLTAGDLTWTEGATDGGAEEISVMPSKKAIDNALLDLESAKNAALASGNIYATTEAGIDAVSDNDFFLVASPDPDEYTVLYQKIGGIAIKKKTLKTSEAVDLAVSSASLSAEAAAAAALIYETASAGQADTALASGDYFWVISATENAALELWQKGASSATFTGKVVNKGTQPAPLTNIAANQNFYDDSNVAFVNALLFEPVANNQLVFKTNAAYGQARIPVTMKSNHHYYVRITAKAGIPDGQAVFLDIYDGTQYVKVDHTGNGEFEVLDDVLIAPSDVSGNIRMVCQSSGYNVTIKELVFIDLTAAFGEGNEPNLAEFRAIYSLATNGAMFAENTDAGRYLDAITSDQKRKPFYVHIEKGQLTVIQKYSKDLDLKLVWEKQFPNFIFNLSAIYFMPNTSDVVRSDYLGGNLLIDVQGDLLGPYNMKAVNNADGDDLNNSHFTGGAHGYTNNYNNVPENTPTARNEYVRFYIGDKEVDYFSGYTDGVEVRWQNYIQANNTKKADGSGREVLEETYSLTYKDGRFFVHNTIKFLEPVLVSQYYGLQALVHPIFRENVYYHTASNNKVNSSAVNSDSGSLTCDKISHWKGQHNIDIELDVTTGLGKLPKLNTITANAIWKNYGKSYFFLMDETQFDTDEIYTFAGNYRFYWD